MLYWRHALDRFASSPVVGIGFGRFTDAQLHGWGVPGVLDLALEGSELVTAPGGAHNSYLHLLAENGLVGLGLMLALWAAIARRLSVLAHSRPRGDEVRAAALAGQAVVVFALVGACFGHALAAPTVCLPALAILGVLVAAGAPHAAPLAPRKRGQTPFPGADTAARRRASRGKGV
jgi:O-antigen ligase